MEIQRWRLSNQFSLPCSLIEQVRKAVGSDYPLLYRLGVYDGQEGGVTTSECQGFARKLVEAGVNMVDVSGGLVGSRPKGSASQGYFLPLAEKIEQAVEVPVIGVGGIKDPEFADDAIRQNRVDLVAVGRAILADPDWALNAAKTLSRRAADRDHGDKTVTKR